MSLPQNPMIKFYLSENCVSAKGELIRTMVDCSVDVSYSTIRKHCVDLKEFEESLGYVRNPKKGLTIWDDYAVSFHRSKYKGKRCYYIVHSAIEYIWMSEK